MTVLQDLRIAGRRLLRAPWFCLFATGMLSVAIGSVLASFVLIEALFLRGLPIAEPSKLLSIYQSRDGVGFFPMSFRDFVDVRAGSHSLRGVAAHYPSAPLSLRTESGLQEINGSVVSANYFSLLGLEPARGRYFLAEEDDTSGKYAVAVISHRLWQTRFGGGDALGRSLEINGTMFDIVGITPKGFSGLMANLPTDIWIPIGKARTGYRWCDPFSRDCTYLMLFGRFAEGRTAADVRAEMAVLGDRLGEIHRSRGDSSDAVLGLQTSFVDGMQPAARPEVSRRVALLSSAALLVLLVTAANLGGLLVGRGLLRYREVATRRAFGAEPSRIVSLFVAESVWLSTAGTLGGLVVAKLLMPLVSLFYPGGQAVPWTVDGRTLWVALALAVGVGAVVGLGPGLRAASWGLVAGLQRSPRSSGLGLLAAIQVAVTVLLLICSGLLGRSLEAFEQVGNIDPEQLVTLRSRPRLVDMEPQRAQAFHREVVRRLEARADVESVSLSAGLPPFLFFHPVEVLPADGATEMATIPAYQDAISPGLLKSLGLRLRRGRSVAAEDTTGSTRVVVINEILASRLFADADPVGEGLSVDGDLHEIIGVVEDRSYSHAGQDAPARIFLAYWQQPDMVDARLTVRLAARPPAGEAASRLEQLRAELNAVDPSVPITEVGTFGQRLERNFASVFAAGRLLSASGWVTMGLAAAGIYALLALWVGGRVREIGIRRALGGRTRHIVSWLAAVIWIWMIPAVFVGALGAWLVSPFLASYLYGVEPRDPVIFTGASLLVVIIAGVAAWWPARRACEIDPMVVLRHE
ncbi:MAG: ABC transporter permease [Thermoanaerobaculia bacterium]|nr:ABC transporter permease [Thermoanaerobaculia bacterium]